jgi:transposase InsO family protein
MRDIAYLPLVGGEFLYLATVLDCFSRRVVGWSIADHGAQYGSRDYVDANTTPMNSCSPRDQ